MNAITLKVLSWVLPMILGPIVYYAARELLNAAAWIDNLPPVFKRIAVVGVGTLLTAIFAALGVALPAECASLTEPSVVGGVVQACGAALAGKVPVQGIAAGLTAMLIHAIKKQRPNT